MGLRRAILGQIRKQVARFSGEHSEVAPEKIAPYERNLGEDASREVVRAKLERPKGGPAGGNASGGDD